MINKNFDAQKIYFLNSDISLRHTGIESSALLRAQLFDRHLRLPVTILTYKYRSHLATEVAILKQRNKLPKSTIVVSVYDYLQQFWGHKAPDVFIGSADKVVPFKHTENLRYTDDKGQLEAVVVYNALNNRLHYINYFDNGISRRDFYHESGHLSCTQLLSSSSPKKLEKEIFYQYDRKICLIASHQYDDAGKKISTQYQIFDEEGRFIGFLSTLQALMNYFLKQYLSENRPNVYEDINYAEDIEKSFMLLVDRNQSYYQPALELKKLLGPNQVKVITTIHNIHAFYDHQGKVRGLNTNYQEIFKDLTAPDAIIVQTDIQRQNILDEFDNPKNIYAIPHPYTLSVNHQVNLERKPLKAVYFARYSIDKKHELAIEAFAKVAAKIPTAEFHCFGIGGRLAELKDLVKDLGMVHNIFLHNWCDNVAIEYESAALSIISSPSESFGLTIAESLAHGCPVVAFDVPYGAQELVQPGENGYLVTFGDTEAMADKVLEIMQNPTLQVRLSNNARQSAERYSEKAVGDKWLQLFQAII